MKKLLVVISVLLLGGCSSYTLVKPEPVKVGGITASPSNAWNAVPALERIGGRPTWTKDGVALNSITFFPAVKDGKPLFKSTKKEKHSPFTADMLPNEIVEIVEASLAKELGAVITNRSGLKPLSIDGNPGFQFNFDFVQNSIPRRALVAGAIKNGSLHLIFYQATRLYYYDKYIQDVMAMAANMKLN